MIDPGKIPEFTGDLAQLETDYADLKKDAGKVRGTGADVHTQFQGLSAYYQAPEADQLFATTKPVKDRADTFGDHLETVSGALSAYATEIRPLVTRLQQLKTEATTFVNSVKDDHNWQYDGDKVKHHNQIRDDITTTVAAFWAAERTCHNKITALWGGTQMVPGDGTNRKNQYGYNADDLKSAKLPWGDPVEEKHHWYEVGHWVKSFVWDGIVVDGIWGTLKGLGTLVGFGGWDAMGQAWKGLAHLATGLALNSIPGLSTLFWTLPDNKLPSWIRDSRTAMKQTGKALLAWDEWGKNPARAAGAVTFNVLTAVFTDGGGAAAESAGKAGAVAKALSIAGKAGKVIDPMTYITKGAGAGLSKIGDIAKNLKGIGKIDLPKLPENAITLPEGSVKLPDGTVHLPEGAAVPEGAVKLPDGTVKLPDDVPVLPEGTTKLPTEHGAPAQYLDPHGNILDDHGNVVQHADAAPKEPDIGGSDPAEHAGSHDPHTPSPTSVREPALVGADSATHAAEHAGRAVHLGDGVASGAGHDVADAGRVGDETPVVHAGGADTPAVRAGGDSAGVHAGGDSFPRAGAGDHLSLGSADHVPGGHAPDIGPKAEATPASTKDHTPPQEGLDDAGRVHDPVGGPGPADHAPDESGSHGGDTGHDGGHGHGHEPDHAGDTDPNPADDSTDDATGDQPEAETGHGHDGPYDGHEPDYSRPALLPAHGPLTLSDVRNTRDVRTRWERGEEFHRQMWGGGPERHYPVPTSNDPRYPVTATGGRKVDVPVDLPDGRTVAVEVKTYGPYRTITLKDGTHQVIKNEVPLSPHIKEQIHKDLALRKLHPGYDPRWSFTHAGPSPELRAYLTKAKIIFLEYGPTPKKAP